MENVIKQPRCYFEERKLREYLRMCQLYLENRNPNKHNLSQNSQTAITSQPYSSIWTV